VFSPSWRVDAAVAVVVAIDKDPIAISFAKSNPVLSFNETKVPKLHLSKRNSMK